MPLDKDIDITAGFSEYIRLSENGLMDEGKLNEIIRESEFYRGKEYTDKLFVAIIGYNLNLQCVCEQRVF